MGQLMGAEGSYNGKFTVYYDYLWLTSELLVLIYAEGYLIGYIPEWDQ